MTTAIIRDNALLVDDRRYASAAFGRLLGVFGLSELNIDSAEVEPYEDAPGNFFVVGSARLLSQPAKVELYLDFLEGGAFEFRLLATVPRLALSTLHELGILPHTHFVDRLLPHSFPDVTLTFDSGATQLYFCALESDARIELFRGLSLAGLGFEFLRKYAEGSARFLVYATIRLGKTSIETKIEIPLGGGLSPQYWVLSSRSSIILGAGLRDIVHFLGDVFGTSFDKVFPDAFNSIPTFFLDDLEILLDPVTGGVRFVTFRVETVEELKVGGGLSIRKVGLRVNVTTTQSAPDISVTLFGSVKVKEEVSLDLQVMLPARLREDDWLFSMSGGVALSGLTDFQHLPGGGPAADLHLHPGFLRLESLDLKAFEVTFNPLRSVVPRIGLDMAVYAECELIHGLKLKDPKLAFTVVNPFDKLVRSLNGSIAGTIAVGEINFGISAEKRDGGWVFTGTTQTKAIPVGRMLSSVGQKFGVRMPDFLKGLDLENLTLRFETSTDAQAQQSERVRFDCEGAFPVDDKRAKFSLAVDVTRRDAAYTVDLSGELTISTLNFKTHYSKKGSDNFFAAVYSHTAEQKSTRLKDVIGAVSSRVAAYVPESLEVDLKYILLAYEDRGAAGGGSRFLFGVDLATTLKLSDLPLVGKMLPSEQRIGIEDIQILIASEAFDTTLGGKLAGVLPAGNANDNGKAMLQKGLHGGLNVAATLRFGDVKRPLDLPVSGGVGQNPAVTTQAALTTGTDVTSSDNVKWFELQKAFGPVHFNKVGVQYKDGELYVLLNAAITVSGLTLSLDGLSISSPLNKFAPKFHLRGVGIDYRNAALEIGGSLLQIAEKSYAGSAVVKFKQLSLSALGAYEEMSDGHPSMFVYAVLDYPIGGPSFFFVTGLSAGFGYGRALKVPTIDKVATFSLVENARRGAGMPENILDELNKMGRDIQPASGENFLAIGLKFSSFKIVDSFALLTVSFGNHFEMNLLGLSTLVAPPNAGAGIPPVAKAQLALKASFQPDKGFLGVQAELTPNSYLLSKDCHLTGGFAFYSWFAGSEHDGDFALTLGGYHPNFRVPEHYPNVPRLAFNWQVSPELSLKGDAYFALTASALMAGGHLEANWLSGSVHAWFKLGADFLLAWQPYHYEIAAYVGMGVDVTFQFFGTQHISIDVGADLKIWGPEFSGEATIHLWIISFTVKFGAAAPDRPAPITWPAFKTSFLPADKDVCAVAVTAGIVSKGESGAGYLGTINPKQFSLATNSVVPSTAAQYVLKDSKRAITLSRSPGRLGIAPMGVAAGDLTSTHTITIRHKGKSAGEERFVGNDFDYTPIFKKVPKGQWGESVVPELNGEQFVEHALSGFVIRPKQASLPGDVAVIERRELLSGVSGDPAKFSWAGVKPFAALSFDSERQRRDELRSTIMAGAAVRLATLRGLGFRPEDVGHIALSERLVDDFLIAPQIERSGGA